MPNKDKMAAKTARRRKRMTRIAKYWLEPKAGKKGRFSGTLLATFNFGAKRLALFSVPKATPGPKGAA
jgi:hypothetical protein